MNNLLEDELELKAGYGDVMMKIQWFEYVLSIWSYELENPNARLYAELSTTEKKALFDKTVSFNELENKYNFLEN